MRSTAMFKIVLRRSIIICFAMLLLIGGQFAAHSEAASAPADAFDGVPMVHVPAGCYYFTDPRLDTDAPDPSFTDQRCFDHGYWIDKYEVTNGDFARLHGQAVIPSDLKHPRQPRVHITWYEADAFCKLRGGALPDETAWEYAARGPKDNLYPNGNLLRWGTFAGFHQDGTDGAVADVGSYPASASWVGAQDMIGNVWEWTATTPEDNLRSMVLTPGERRVIREGAVSYSYYDEDAYLTAFRTSADANNEAWDAGFRCIRAENSGALPVATTQYALITPTPTDELPPTDTPSPVTLNPAATPIPAGSSNGNWTPIEQTFGGFVMDYVPAGCFNMGTDNIADYPFDPDSIPDSRNEFPRHPVCLTSPYWIDQYEVTNGQYKHLTGAALSIMADTDMAVSPISWNDADAFCKLRGGQLPTEAQWEYAARGPEGWVYPWGNHWDVKQLDNPSWVGVLDLNENLLEWVADWYGPYTDGQGVTNDPQGPASGTYRVLRGSAVSGPPLSSHTAYRIFNRPDVPPPEASIRCIRPVRNATNATATAVPIVPTLTPTIAAPTVLPVTPIPTLIPAGTANTFWTPVTVRFKGVQMQRVPAGCFFMGETSQDGVTGHEVCITKPFWIDLTEVTNNTFTTLHGRALVNTRNLGGQHPRSEISWAEARTFCIARGGNLPTEAQWEYAARGPEGLLFPYGNNRDLNKELAWDTGRPANVGSNPAGASWIGAVDMSSNVGEWVLDWNDETYVANGPKNDPPGPDKGTERVVLGLYTGPYLESSILDDRYHYVPTERNDWVGFRCMLPDSAKPDAMPSASPTPGK